jgi:hypothetical protein
MNTTKLIAQWTMSGVRTDDIRAVIARKKPTPEPSVAASSFVIKGPDEVSRQPLGEEENHCA